MDNEHHINEQHIEELTFAVPGMTCGHCEAAVKEEVGKVAGVSEVHVNLESKVVVVHGTGIDHAAVFAAVDEAGFEAVTGAF